MKLFPKGIKLTKNERRCLEHINGDIEEWLLNTIILKANARRDALINLWIPKLYADPAIKSLPASPDGIAGLILKHPDYLSRSARDRTMVEPIPEGRHFRDYYASLEDEGRTVTIFASGITVSDFHIDCIHAYVQNIEEWVLGAILGNINRQKSLIIKQYRPELFADSDVQVLPGTENELLSLIFENQEP